MFSCFQKLVCQWTAALLLLLVPYSLFFVIALRFCLLLVGALHLAVFRQAFLRDL
jgi:hypothetical protein